MLLREELKITDYFIQDSGSMSLSALYRHRTLVVIVFLGWFLSFAYAVLSFLGFLSDEASYFLFLLFSLNIALLRFTNLVPLVMWIIIAGGTAALIFNISITDYIYSYNHKWFIVIMILVNFYLPKYTLFYLLFACCFQVYSYQITPADLHGIVGPKEDYLFDNILALLFCYWLLRYFINLHQIQSSVIDEQNIQLKNQKKELVEGNSLLQKKTDELLISNNELERFAHMASHDLKTPLNNIISFSLLLEEELKNYKNEAAHQYFDFIKEGGQKMLKLIKDILEFSVNSSDNTKDEFIDLNELLDSIKSSISFYINSNNAEVVALQNLPIMKANKTKAYLLFKNLIENGIKYNNNSAPKVTIKVGEEKGLIIFKIQDNGIGISPKYQEEIFQMFTRLHNNFEYEGTGLGLALCKKIVNELDGEIKLNSIPKRGSEFILTFPKSRFVEYVELKIEDLV